MLSAAGALAQRISYESLRMRDRQSNVFLEHLVIPNAEPSQLTLVSIFRLENNFLFFRRYQGNHITKEQRSFYAEPTLRLTVRKADSREDERLQESKRPRGAWQSRESLSSQDTWPPSGNSEVVASSSWRDTIYTETYEQTQSASSFVQNLIKTDLFPGVYSIEYMVASDNQTRRGRSPQLRVVDTSNTDIAYFYFLDNQSELPSSDSTPLMNMGHNVFYGRDHQLAIWFPEIHDEADYALEIHKLQIQHRDTSVLDLAFEHSIDKEQLISGFLPEISQKDHRPHFNLHSSNASRGQFYILHIPNSKFENAWYRIRLRKKMDEDEKIIASRTYQSLWLDMPISLLNIDVAINMLRFILDSERVRSLQSGNRREKEQQFREFWAGRDPSPDSEYNELMVEYYRRIDYAFEHFTTPQTPGYESDLGKVYIRHGEPVRRERNFPPNQPAREIWHYDGHTFVFEATTGFGDYQLVERR